jgi:hypothetical protein
MWWNMSGLGAICGMYVWYCRLFMVSKYVEYGVAGLDCCSERAISFHYVNPYEMLQLEFLIYKLK